MTWTIPDTRQRIRDAGLRATAPRTAVLRFFSGANKPISHTELVNALSETQGDQATLYRTLKTFQGNGLLRIVSKVEGIARYELASEIGGPQHVHPHFVCKICGIVSCLPETTVITTINEQWKELLKSCELQFVGMCIPCRDA